MSNCCHIDRRASNDTDVPSTPRSRANDKERNGANEAERWQEAPGDDECVMALTPVSVSALGRLIRLALAYRLRLSFLLALL